MESSCNEDIAASSPIKRPDLIQCSSSTSPNSCSRSNVGVPFNTPTYVPPLPLPSSITEPIPKTTAQAMGRDFLREWPSKPPLKVLYKRNGHQALRSNVIPSSRKTIHISNEHHNAFHDNATNMGSLNHTQAMLSSKDAPIEHTVIDVTPVEPLDQTLGIPEAILDESLRSPLGSRLLSEHKSDWHCQVVHQYPLVSGQIPPARNEYMKYTKLVAHPRMYDQAPSVVQGSAMVGQGNVHGASKGPGEKNKVKFSDTITVAVVPEIPRKDKLSDRLRGHHLSINRNAYSTDPRRELADSLPLCHPNEDYLKDFQPIQEGKSMFDASRRHISINLSIPERPPSVQEEREDNLCRNPGTIKVIHFGVV